MLECGTNFKGTHSTTCTNCNTTDNEHHRMNECPKWQNLSADNEMIDFNLIYSNSIDSIRAKVNQQTSSPGSPGRPIVDYNLENDLSKKIF